MLFFAKRKPFSSSRNWENQAILFRKLSNFSDEIWQKLNVFRQELSCLNEKSFIDTTYIHIDQTSIDIIAYNAISAQTSEVSALYPQSLGTEFESWSALLKRYTFALVGEWNGSVYCHPAFQLCRRQAAPRFTQPNNEYIEVYMRVNGE